MVGWPMITFEYVCCLVLKRTNITESVALIILMQSDGATVKYLTIGLSDSVGYLRRPQLLHCRTSFPGSFRNTVISPSVHQRRPDFDGVSSSIGPSDTIGRDFRCPRVRTLTTFHSLFICPSIGHDLTQMESVCLSVHRTRTFTSSQFVHRSIGHHRTPTDLGF